MWLFEAFGSLFWFLYGLLPWKEAVLRRVRVVSSGFVPSTLYKEVTFEMHSVTPF